MDGAQAVKPDERQATSWLCVSAVTMSSGLIVGGLALAVFVNAWFFVIVLVATPFLTQATYLFCGRRGFIAQESQIPENSWYPVLGLIHTSFPGMPASQIVIFLNADGRRSALELKVVGSKFSIYRLGGNSYLVPSDGWLVQEARDGRITLRRASG